MWEVMININLWKKISANIPQNYTEKCCILKISNFKTYLSTLFVLEMWAITYTCYNYMYVYVVSCFFTCSIYTKFTIMKKNVKRVNVARNSEKNNLCRKTTKKSTNAMFLFQIKLHILLVAIWQYYEKFKLTRIAHFSITNCFQRFFFTFPEKIITM